MNTTTKYYIGPYLSCFFAVYSRRFGDICCLTDYPMTKKEAEKKMVELNKDPYKYFKGVGLDY